jgi:hypothetical protein
MKTPESDYNILEKVVQHFKQFDCETNFSLPAKSPYGWCLSSDVGGKNNNEEEQTEFHVNTPLC